MKISFRGQSLTEILVALALGVSFINVGILAMTTTNFLARINKANSYALSLLKSQSSILETISENGWHSIADLTIGKHYKLAKQNNSWIVQPGEEKVFDEKPPVAQWNMDEGSGTITYDNVGTNNGTLVGSPIWQTAPNCVNSGCLNFNGSQYVDVGTDSKLTPSNITLSAWVNASTLDQWDGIISNMTSWGTGFGLQIGTVQNIAAMVSGSYLKTTWTPVANTWYYIVATHDSATNLNILYVNGSEEARSTQAISYESNPKTYIGVFYTSPNLLFKGKIDEVSIYDYALGANQVRQHYNAGLNRLGLVSQWGMDEGSGTITYDSQSSNNGTLVNSPTWQAKTNCISGNCLGFNGTTNYVDLGTPSSLMAVTYPYTITAWAKLTALAQNAIIMSFAPTDTASQLAFGVYNTGNQILIGNAAYTYGLSGISSYLKVNTWQYWTIVFADPTHISFYLDGQNKTITNIAQYYSPINNNIGARQNGGDKWFNGSIDDVRLYNRALSPDEIANQYKDGYTKYFYVNNVSRDIASDPTASTHNLETAYNANHDDPNTKKIINITRYLQGPSGRVNSEEQYLARVNNISSLIQTDWSGASGIDGPEIDFGNNYSSANNLTLSEAGQISLNSTASNGSLISSIADTQSVGGAGYFNILWQGDTLCTGCSVKFQIAASNSQNGPWTYYGPTSTSDYYIPNSPNVAVPITYAGQYSALSSSIQNKRYIRYQITLVPASSQSPVVKDVIINYAP